MAHHCIKYRLTAEGTVPSFLCLHPEGVGGVYVVGDSSTPSPRDMVMIGLSENDEVGDAEIIPTKADLLTYLTSVSADWTQQDPTQPGDTQARIPFEPSAAADWVWARKTSLDAS